MDNGTPSMTPPPAQPMDIGVKRIVSERNTCPGTTYETMSYKVTIGNHPRVMSVFTGTETILKDWLTDILNHPPPSSSLDKSSAAIIVGFAAGIESTANINVIDYYRKIPAYDFFVLYVGDQCLLFNLECCHKHESLSLRHLKSFFDDPRVVVVGASMDKVAKKLKDDHGISFHHCFDVNALTLEEYPESKNYDLDELAKVVLKVQVPRNVNGSSMMHCRQMQDTDLGPVDFSLVFECRKKSIYDLSDMELHLIYTLDVTLLFLLGKELLSRCADFDPLSGLSNSQKKKLMKKNNKRIIR